MSHTCRPPHKALVLNSRRQTKEMQARSARMPGKSQQGERWVKHGHVNFALLEQCSFCGLQCIVIHALDGWQWSVLWWMWKAITWGHGDVNNNCLCNLCPTQSTEMIIVWHSYNTYISMIKQHEKTNWLKKSRNKEVFCNSVTTRSTFAAFKTHFGYTFIIPTSGNILLQHCFHGLNICWNMWDIKYVHVTIITFPPTHHGSSLWIPLGLWPILYYAGDDILSDSNIYTCSAHTKYFMKVFVVYSIV